MEKIELFINKKKKNLKKQKIIKIEGNFNYYITIEITGEVGTINSNIKILTYASKNRKVITKSNFKWFTRETNKNTISITNELNFLNIDANSFNQIIISKVTPSQENFFGECRIFYGSIIIDKITKKKYDMILKEDYLELDVEGEVINENCKFENLEVFKNCIKANEENLQVVEELFFNRNCVVKSDLDNFLKIKVFFYDRKGSELSMIMKNVNDKNLCLLFLKRKIDIAKNQKGMNLKRINGLDTFSDQSMVKMNIVNDSNSSLLSLNNFISKNNPLKKIINTSKNVYVKNQRSLSLDDKFSRNFVDRVNNNKDQSILNRYLSKTNKINIFGGNLEKNNNVSKREIRIYNTNNNSKNNFVSQRSIKSPVNGNVYGFEKNVKENLLQTNYNNNNRIIRNTSNNKIESFQMQNINNSNPNNKIQSFRNNINNSPNTKNINNYSPNTKNINNYTTNSKNVNNYNQNTNNKITSYKQTTTIEKNNLGLKINNFNKNKLDTIPQIEVNKSDQILLEKMLNSQNKEINGYKIKIEDLEASNGIYQKELKRLKFANEGLKREIMFMQKSKRKNEKNESFMREEKEILFKKQFNVLNEKYRDLKIKFDKLNILDLEKNNLLIEKENKYNDLELLKYDLESRNRIFEEKIGKYEKDNQYYGKKNNLLELELEKSKMNLKKIEKLENNLRNKEMDIENYQNHCEYLEKEKNIIILENEELKKIIEKKENKILECENMIHNKNDVLKLEKIKENEFLVNIKNLKNQIREKDEMIEDKLNRNDLEEEFIVLKKKYYILTDENNDIKNIKEDIENENINLQKKIIDLDTKLKEREISDMTEKDEKMDLLQNKIKNLKFNEKDLLAKLDINFEEEKLLKNKIYNYEQDINLLKTEKDEITNENKILKKKIEMNEKKNKKDVNNESKELIDNLKDQLQKKEESYFEYQDNMTKLREDIFYLREDKFELNEKLNLAISKLKNYRNVKEKYEDSILLKENEIFDLKRKINTNQIDNIHDIKKENNFDNKKLLKLKKEIKEYKNKLQNEKENVINLKNLLKDKSNKSILLQNEIDLLKLRKPMNFSFSTSNINQNNPNSDENEISELQRKMNIKNSKILSMQKELNARSSRVDELINYIKKSNKSENSNLLIKILNELKKIKNDKENLEKRYNDLKNKQLLNTDNFLDNIEIDDFKEKLISALSFYKIDLIEEFQYKDLDDILNKIKELLKLLKDNEISLEKNKFVLLETNNLLKKYEDDRVAKEKLIKNLEEEKETLLYSLA